jgi:hypothetical protein
MATLGQLLSIIAPKKSAKKGGVAATPTFNPQQTQNILTVPQYREHLTDIFNSRQADDSRTLLKDLFKTDPDMSAAVFSYLTMANTDPFIVVRDMEGQIDRDATKQLHQIIKKMTVPTDYTLGFQLKKPLAAWCEEMRYMCLLRGAIGLELILDDKLSPADLRNVDMSTVEWYERKAGEYKPVQKVPGVQGEINLDLPTFFVSFFRRDPTSIYAHSTFVSSVNTIAARQQVINDLYRIMQRTGYPRLDIKVVEEVLLKNVPAGIRTDASKTKEWMNARLNEVRSSFEGIRADQAFVHWDSVEPSILNDKNPGLGIDISSIIDTLNAQNQAGLKTMATVIGRGSAGVNTSSVESRIAAMNADELNEPVAAILSNVCSFIMHQTGYQGFAEVSFKKAEMRPDLELEPQLMLRTQRLRQDLSDGLITDDEYHIMVYNRLRPDSVEELSGTKFMGDPTKVAVDAEKVSPNGDSLGRSLAPEGGKAHKSAANK